ncbi:MAG: GNAT family N-acetyltransferase [Candidatus Curtissbacteria bacterium]|nr:GNAT family N-acetyltransferase [Candidatus Curtissbacteria bacterium]
MQLRKFTQGDIQTVRLFDKKHAPHPPKYHIDTTNELTSFFNKKSFVCYGLYHDRVMVGHVSYWKDTKNIYYLNALVIHTQHRKKGLASNVFNKIKEEIKEKGGKEIFLTVSPLNKDAISFYEKQGFKVYNSKTDVYSLGSDRLYMKFTL